MDSHHYNQYSKTIYLISLNCLSFNSFEMRIEHIHSNLLQGGEGYTGGCPADQYIEHYLRRLAERSRTMIARHPEMVRYNK